MRLLVPEAQGWKMWRIIHCCTHPLRNVSLTQTAQEVFNRPCYFSKWIIDGLFINDILMVGWSAKEVCLKWWLEALEGSGPFAELQSVVDRAEVYLSSWRCLSRHIMRLLGPVLLFWQEQVFSQPGQKPAEHRPASSCVLTSLPCGIPHLASVCSAALSHFYHQHFPLPFLLIICPFFRALLCYCCFFSPVHKIPSYCLCLPFYLEHYCAWKDCCEILQFSWIKWSSGKTNRSRSLRAFAWLTALLGLFSSLCAGHGQGQAPWESKESKDASHLCFWGTHVGSSVEGCREWISRTWKASKTYKGRNKREGNGSEVM